MTGWRTSTPLCWLAASVGCVLGGCDGSDPQVTPASRTIEVVRPAPVSQAARAAQVVENGGVVSCGSMTVTAEPPEQVESATCGEEYAVNFRIEVDVADTALINFFRPYRIADWSITTSGDRIQHGLRLLWAPYARDFIGYSSAGEIRPLMVQVCPDTADRRVLACSDQSCTLYADEDDVPPVSLPSLGVVVRSPWSYSDVRELTEGNTIQIPVSYDINRSRSTDMTVSIRRGDPVSSRRFEITPSDREISLSRARSGTVTFRVTATRDRFRQRAGIETFHIDVEGSAQSRAAGCAVAPNPIRLRVSD